MNTETINDLATLLICMAINVDHANRAYNTGNAAMHRIYTNQATYYHSTYTTLLNTLPPAERHDATTILNPIRRAAKIGATPRATRLARRAKLATTNLATTN